MQVVCAVGQGLGVEPFLPLVRHPVIIGVSELPNTGRSSNVDRAVVPKHTLGKHHLVCEHSPLVVPTVPVHVLQTENAVGALDELLPDVVVGAGRLGDVQPTQIIHVHDHRSLGERGPCDNLDFEALGNSDLVGSASTAGVAADQGRDQEENWNDTKLHGAASAVWVELDRSPWS